ncbi:MAG: hypothetical protein Fur0018_02920 [Anaerolineales bacterium]
MKTTALSPELRFILARKSVDDRAINRYVFGILAREIARRPADTPSVRILDIHGQAGVMLTRLLEWRLFERARYTQLTGDTPPDIILHWWRMWCKTWNTTPEQKKENVFILRQGSRRARVRLRPEDITACLSDLHPTRYDLIIAHDTPALPDILPGLLPALKPGGFLYATANLNGLPHFSPAMPQDDLLQDLTGQYAAGRRLIPALRENGLRLFAIGASDAIIHPDHTGAYPGDEAFYLHSRITQLADVLRTTDAPPDALQTWLSARQQHLQTGSLYLFAPQYDLLAQKEI